jgi:bacterioferritin
MTKRNMTKQSMIEALHGDLADEYASAVQYIHHAELMTGGRFDSLQKKLRDHATDEMLHATTLADQVECLGGRPLRSVDAIAMPDATEEMLRQDLARERVSVARYNVRILDAIALGEYDLARVLQEILVTEEEHVEDLENALAR